MHFLYFVVIPKEEAEDKQGAMEYAIGFLEENGFAGDSGIYTCPKADWYEVGGRWSGAFTSLQEWYKDFDLKVSKLLKKKYPELESGVDGVFYGSKNKEKQKEEAIEEVIKIWDECKPEEYSNISCPIGRSGTFSWGKSPRHDTDDIMLMTSDLFKKMKKEYKEVEFIDTEEQMEGTIDMLKEEHAINKWWVVIDYHN